MEYREIRTADDVTAEHVEMAADLRDGMYGGHVASWEEVIQRLEIEGVGGEDWGSDMDSPAIRELKKRVRKVMADDS